ncbi:hypothetical protein Y032_0020g175 [Ancylostoma ceylanicum]|nr:hypothetical protein Y032_0020g175 [Ancylostoma ceylanicum]
MVANRRHSQPKKAKPSKLPLQTSPKATDEHDLESNKSNSEELSDALLQRQLQFSFYFLLANLETRRKEILRGTDREGTYDSNPT